MYPVQPTRPFRDRCQSRQTPRPSSARQQGLLSSYAKVYSKPALPQITLDMAGVLSYTEHCSVIVMGVHERRARQKESVREEILDAARTLFVKEGYEHASIRKIADKIEYSPGTIYLYFRDKAEILDQICQETFAKLAQKQQAINKDASDPLECLRRGLRTYVHFGIENPNHYILTFVQAKQKLSDAPSTTE